MAEINLHFTGDFHAITAANNLLAAMLDNHLYWGNALGIDTRRVTWRRALDMNDRALRGVVVGLGGGANGVPREDGFDITVASEVMAVFCLSRDLADLQERLGRMIVAPGRDGPVTARDLKADGAMAALLRDALQPNLVQTLEGSPALVHGGPFANIAHGCNSVMATRLGLKLADIVVTEAGFGADLGGEKFLDIKCRSPGCARLLRRGGDGAGAEDAWRRGTRRPRPRERRRGARGRGEPGAPCREHGQVRPAGGGGAQPLHRRHRRRVRRDPRGHAGRGRRCCVRTGPMAVPGPRSWRARCWRRWRRARPLPAALSGRHAAGRQAAHGGAGDLPRGRYRHARRRGQAAGSVRGGRASADCRCASPRRNTASAPTRQLLGAPTGHVLPVREVRLSAGAGFVVAVCGDIMTMPGLPRHPAAERHTGWERTGEIDGPVLRPPPHAAVASSPAKSSSSSP